MLALWGSRAATAFWKMSNKCNKPGAGLKSSTGRNPLEPTSRPTKKPDVIYLGSPIKSESDTKEYTAVKLSNGLTALVISDVNNLISLDEVNAIETSEAESGDDSDSPSSAGSICSSGKGVVKSSTNPEEKLAACSLSVGVGSFSDPVEIPGLAHFLEHMVFMGSDKYPKENEFDSYIKKKGGSDNASTDCEVTTYYFECQERHLHHSMDMFSHFFISPLMKREAMTREREAIESEFTMSTTSDTYRKEQLLCGTAVDNNPAGKFMWGNLKTLKDNVTDDVLHKSVHDFWRKNYSANLMTLAVQARLPTETLIEWIDECFSGIPNTNKDLPRFEVPEPLFKDDFTRMYYVESVKDISEVEINWVLPPVLHLYKSRPTDVISWLIGHEGKGSLVAYLRKKNWGLDIVAGHEDDGLSSNMLYTMFNITVVLSEEGMNNVDRVLKAIFSYINMAKKTGPVPRLFKEMQSVAEIEFKYMTDISAVENVEMLSENMQRYPPDHYIAGSELFFEYNPSLISQFLGYLAPSKANVMISGKNLPVNPDRTEPWFKTKYAVRDIPPSIIEQWERIEVYPEFHIPDPNPFIADDFSLQPVLKPDQKYPEKIKQTDGIEVWYKQDNKFKLPNGIIRFHVLTPTVFESLESATLLDVYVSLLKQVLSEDLYPAVSAQLRYSISISNLGLNFILEGYNQKLPILLETLLRNVLDFKNRVSDEHLREMIKVQARAYLNYNLKPSSLEKELRLSAIVHNYFTTAQKYSLVRGLTYKGLLDFSDNLFNNVYTQCLAQGNLTQEGALLIADYFLNTLQCKRNSETPLKGIQVFNVPFGEHCLRVNSFNKDDANSVTTNYFQSGPGTIALTCKADLLTMLMEEPLFNTLRTQEQLGYDVSCRMRLSFGIVGFSISVNSQADKCTVDHVEQRITAFMETFLQDLKMMDEEDYNEVASSLIKLKQCADLYLKEEADRNWEEIKTRSYKFDRRDLEVSTIRGIGLPEMVSFVEDHTLPHGPNYKKLVIQVVGTPQKIGDNLIEGAKRLKRDMGDKGDNLPERIEYDFVTAGEDKELGYFIRDINDFKRNLQLYPVIKVTE